MRNALVGWMVVGLCLGFTQGANGQQGQSASADQQIASCVLNACSNEIEIAKFAESKAQSEDVREFAQRMVREHTPGCEAMKRRAGDLAGETAAQPRPGGGLDWIAIHKQMSQQCLASAKQELSQKQGAEFDKCFTGAQVGAHMQIVDALKVLRNYASPELKQDLDKELQVAQTHLQQAKQLAQQIDERPSERVTRRPEANK